MKRIWKYAAISSIVALVAATAPTMAHAGSPRGHKPPPRYGGGQGHGHSDNDTAAAIFGGLAVVGVIAAIASAQHNDAAVNVGVSYGHGGTRGSVYYEQPAPRPVWVAGYHQVEREKVCIPGYWDEIVEPAEYRKVRRGCDWVYIQVRPQTVRRVWVAERYEWQETKVWVPGHWEQPGCQTYARVY